MIKLVISQYFYDQLNIDLGQGALLGLDQKLVNELGLVIELIGGLLELNWGKKVLRIHNPRLFFITISHKVLFLYSFFLLKNQIN